MPQLTDLGSDDMLREQLARCRRCCCGATTEYEDLLAELALDGDEYARAKLVEILAARAETPKKEGR